MKEFPKTGEKEAIYLVLLGFIFIVASLVVLTKNSKKYLGSLSIGNDRGKKHLK